MQNKLHTMNRFEHLLNKATKTLERGVRYQLKENVE